MSRQKKITEIESKVKVDTKQEPEIQCPDGGWGWVVCFAAFLTDFTVSGMTSTSGIILLGLLDHFNEPISKTALVGSVLSGTTMCGGPLVLVLVIWGANHRNIMIVGGLIAAAATVASAFAPAIEILILTYGFLAGLSLALCYFCANIILGCYFKKKRALALGIANSGAGCGSFLLNYLCQKSISFYGMSGTFLLIGGLFLNLVVFGALCRPLKPVIKSTHNIPESRRNSEDKEDGENNLAFTPDDENSDTQSEKSASSCRYSIDGIEPIPETLQMRKLSVYSDQIPSDFGKLRSRFCDVTIFRNRTFGLLLVIYFLWAVGDSMLIYLPSYAKSLGLSGEEGAMIMVIYGIFASLSQILAGFLADVVHIPISYLLFLTMLGMSLSIGSFPFCQTFATLASSTIVFSISYCFGTALRIVILAAVLGIDKMSEAYSIESMLIGVGYTIYPIVTGVVYDATNSYALIFYTDSALTFLGAILTCGIIYEQKNGNFLMQ